MSDRKRSASCLLLPLLCSTWPLELRAQEPDDKAVAAEPLEVTVRSSKEPDTFTSTRAATTVTEQETREAFPGSLADALRTRGGVSVQQTTPGQGTIYVRGLAGREIVYMVDGVRLNTAVFRSPNNASLGLIDPYSLSMVEVIRGPSSVLHGSDALGGIVSMTTTLPGYVAAEPVTRLFALQNLSSNPTGTTSRLAFERRDVNSSGYLGLTYLQQGNVRPGEGLLTPDPASFLGLEREVGKSYGPVLSDEQRGTDFQRLAADGALRHKLGSGLDLVLRGQMGYRPKLTRYDEITPRFKRSFPARAESFLGPMSRTMTSATLVQRRDSAFYDTALLAVAWQRISEHQHRRDFEEECLTGGSVGDCTTRLRLSPAPAFRREDTRSDSLSARGELKFLSDNRKRGASLGIETIHDIVTSNAENVDVESGAATSAAARYPSGATMTQAGAFGQFELQLSPVLRAHVGARGAFFALNIPGRPGVDPELGGVKVRSSLFDASLSAGLSWEMTPGLFYVLNAGRGVRAPNIEDFSGLGSRAGGRFQVPNPNLQPEHVHSADLGVKVSRPLWRAQTFVFFSRFEDAVGLAPATVNGESRSPDGTRYVRSANVSRLDFYGLESDLRLGVESAGGVFARALAVSFDERAQEGVSAAERVLAPLQGTLGAWFWLSPRVRLEAFAIGRAAQRRVANPDDNRIPLDGTPGFVTYHARCAWDVTPSVRARLSLDNLSNELALEHGSGYYLPGFGATAGVEASLMP